MRQYVLQRLALMVPVAFLVTLISFALLRLTPGDPVEIYAGDLQDPEYIERVRHELGLDQPAPVQYVAWLSHAARGDLGRSFRLRKPVLEAIAERVPRTLQLGLAALVISTTVALAIGILSAVKRDSVLDLLSTGAALVFVSLPNFVLGLVLIIVFALVVRLFPPGGYVPFDQDPLGNLRSLVLPAVTLAAGSMAVKMRQMRSSLLDVLHDDYIRTARSKGLRERMVLLRHAVPNALLPVITIVGLQVGAIIEGAIITETIFFWPGVGRLAVESINARDYNVVQAIVLISALSFMISTLVTDLAYGWADPRIAYASPSR